MVNEGVKMTLRSLCMSHGWSYAVFWRFDPLNNMVLTMEDAYSEEHFGSVVGSMIMQVHRLGEGIIGEASLDGNHRWMSADALSWDVSEFGLQSSSGIKTIAVVPVEMLGVVQLGSMHEISETRELVIQVRKCLQEALGMVPKGSVSSSLNSDGAGQCELFASMSSSQHSLCGDVSTSWANMGGSSVFDLLDAQLGHCEKFGDGGELLIDPGFDSLIKRNADMFEEHSGGADLPPFKIDDLSQWLSDSSELCLTSLDAMLSDDTQQAFGFDGVSSVLSRDGDLSIQDREPDCSLRSSFSDSLHSCSDVETLGVTAKNDQNFAEFGTDIGCGKLVEPSKDVVSHMGHSLNSLPFGSGVDPSECISEEAGRPAAAPRKGLFSELGLEHLLRGDKGASSSLSSKSCIDDQWPASKKRRVEGYQMMNNQFQHTGASWGAKLMQPPSIGAEIQDFKSFKDCMPKSQAGVFVDDSCGMDAKSCISTVNSQSMKSDEPAKATKKKARPGESKRPRPKDRQQIAERISELRDLIPNGAKLSIDALLGRTIKHMDYLQNLTKHSDNIKQVHDPKLIGQGKGLVQKGGSRGATWAFEVGGSNILCPIIVEDLGHPRQMLIEMLCEERGYFLEMADIVKSFDLTILKGVMEERNGKIWAQFTVEAKKPVKRMDVFVSLMHIFQGATTNEVATTIEPETFINGVSPLWGNYQHVVPISI